MVYDKMAHPKQAEQLQVDLSPFSDLLIDDNSILNTIEGRELCPLCNKSRKLFCYSCYVPIKSLENKIPTVKLPLKIDIIKHKFETDGKSTSGHAAVLASEDVKVYTYPNIPDYTKERAVLVFPSMKALSINQLVSQNSYEEVLKLESEFKPDMPKGFNKTTLLNENPKNKQLVLSNFGPDKKLPIDKVVFIDSTWNQSKGIYKDERIKRIPCVVIENRISQFWRHQKGSPRWYLSTIEAIHQFLIETHLYLWGLDPTYKGINNCFTESLLTHVEHFYSNAENAYRGQYDNLLYFFKYMYYLIHTYYKHEDLHAYTRRLG